MRYPKKLSKERLSLLTPDELKIYESEWSSDNKQQTVDDIFDENSLNESIEVSENEIPLDVQYALDEIDYLFNTDLKGLISESDLDAIKKEFIYDENFNENDIIYNELSEKMGEGHDCTYWLDGLKLGWLGKLVGAGLAALGTGLFALLVAGKDYLAIQKLRIYMSKIVETIDQGTLKRKAWYSFMLPKKTKKYAGEYNNGCFRTIQETTERHMTTAVMNAAQKLGYFKKGGIADIKQGSAPQTGSGLADFKKNVADKLQVVD